MPAQPHLQPHRAQPVGAPAPSAAMGTRSPRLLFAASFLLFAIWSFVVPIYETPDEPAHWQYARHLREHWTLPLYTPEFYEANSPPLGYVLFAPFAVSDASP